MRFLYALLFFCTSLAGQDINKNQFTNTVFKAKVISITDGDTMAVLYQHTPIKIRLAHIDCPEKRGKQPYGNEAKIALSKLCFGTIVTIKSEKYDSYKRLIAVVVSDKNKNINQEMVKLGMAWHFLKYSKNPVYSKLQQQARKNRVGLWKDDKPVEPWLWRKK